MSQLNVDTLKDRTGALQPTIVGAAKAFVNFNGKGTVAIRDSFNVDSITDNGVGVFTANFTNAMSTANFTGQVTAWDPGITAGDGGVTARATTSIQVSTTNSIGSASVDHAENHVTVHSN